MKINNIIRVKNKEVLWPLSEYEKALVIEEGYSTMSFQYVEDLTVDKIVPLILEQFKIDSIRNVLIKVNHQEYTPEVLNILKDVAKAVKKEKIKIYSPDYMENESVLQKMINDYYHYCSIDVDSLFMLRQEWNEPISACKLMQFHKFELAIALQQCIDDRSCSIGGFNLMLKDNGIDINDLNKALKNSIYLSYMINMGFYTLDNKLQANIVPYYDFDTYISRIKRHMDSFINTAKAMNDIKESSGFGVFPKTWDEHKEEEERQKNIMSSAIGIDVSSIELEVEYKHQLDNLIGKPNGLRSDLLYIIKDKTFDDIFYKNNELEFSDYDIISIGKAQELKLVSNKKVFWYAFRMSASDNYLVANLKHPNKEYVIVIVKRKSDKQNVAFAVLKDIDIDDSMLDKLKHMDEAVRTEKTKFRKHCVANILSHQLAFSGSLLEGFGHPPITVGKYVNLGKASPLEKFNVEKTIEMLNDISTKAFNEHVSFTVGPFEVKGPEEINKHCDADNPWRGEINKPIPTHFVDNNPDRSNKANRNLNFLRAIDNLSTVLRIATNGRLKKYSDLLLEFSLINGCSIQLKEKASNNLLVSCRIEKEDSSAMAEMFRAIDINGIEINRDNYAYAVGQDILLDIHNLKIEQAVGELDDKYIIKYAFAKLAENIGMFTLQRESNQTLSLKVTGIRKTKYINNIKLKPINQKDISDLEDIKFLGPVFLKLNTAMGINNFIKEFDGKNTNDAIYVLNMTYKQAFPFTTCERYFRMGKKANAIEVDGILNGLKPWYVFNFPGKEKLRFRAKNEDENYLIVKVFRNSDNMVFKFAVLKDIEE